MSLTTIAALGLVGLASFAAVPQKAKQVSFQHQILPILKQNCLPCHGSQQPKAGLSLLTYGDLLQGGSSGQPIIPGDPDSSLLVRLIARGAMPQGGKKLAAAQVRLIAQWVNEGAKGSSKWSGGHWAFDPPKAVKPPGTKSPSIPSAAIDRFVSAKLAEKGLSHSPFADRRTYVRRVTYDLIGLPPTPNEVDAYLADSLPGATERLVDRLLADPRYGERWGRHWLDVAGYADSEGVLEEDHIRPTAWRYRDWVIHALNRDLPFDRFLQEQIAGDELVPWRTVEKMTPEMEATLTATGYLRTAVDATRDDFNTHQFVEYQYRMLFDTQQTIYTGLLGLTLQCTRCHDHKYEPFSQRDYYRVQAIFTGAIRPTGKLLPTRRRHIVAASFADQEAARKVNSEADAAIAKLTAEEQTLVEKGRLQLIDQALVKASPSEKDVVLAAARLPENQRTPAQKEALVPHKALLELNADGILKQVPAIKPEIDRLRAAKQTEAAKKIAYTELRAMYDQDANPPDTPILIRGEITRPGSMVKPGVPGILHSNGVSEFRVEPLSDKQTTGRRLAFAKWLTQPSHPLTSRVFVNRVWAQHFGEGIVSSLDNFGRSGEKPTHPELLDWLAVEFARGRLGGPAWSMKALHRAILLSRTYRQSSATNSLAHKTDPDNRLLWRFRPLRLEAEAVRDSILSVAGTLDTKMFGEPVGLEYRGATEVAVAGEADKGRRSLYVLVRRSKPVTFLGAFDAPFIETNCTRRQVSVTPTQSLSALNGTFISAQAAHFANRLQHDVPTGNAGRINLAYQVCFGRTPTARELQGAELFLASQAKVYMNQKRTASESERLSLSDFCQSLLASNEFLYVD